jgi:hypothetical protein
VELSENRNCGAKEAPAATRQRLPFPDSSGRSSVVHVSTPSGVLKIHGAARSLQLINFDGGCIMASRREEKEHERSKPRRCPRTVLPLCPVGIARFREATARFRGHEP